MNPTGPWRQFFSYSNRARAHRGQNGADGELVTREQQWHKAHRENGRRIGGRPPAPVTILRTEGTVQT